MAECVERPSVASWPGPAGSPNAKQRRCSDKPSVSPRYAGGPAARTGGRGMRRVCGPRHLLIAFLSTHKVQAVPGLWAQDRSQDAVLGGWPGLWWYGGERAAPWVIPQACSALASPCIPRGVVSSGEATGLLSWMAKPWRPGRASGCLGESQESLSRVPSWALCSRGRGLSVAGLGGSQRGPGRSPSIWRACFGDLASSDAELGRRQGASRRVILGGCAGLGHRSLTCSRVAGDSSAVVWQPGGSTSPPSLGVVPRPQGEHGAGRPRLVKMTCGSRLQSGSPRALGEGHAAVPGPWEGATSPAVAWMVPQATPKFAAPSWRILAPRWESVLRRALEGISVKAPTHSRRPGRRRLAAFLAGWGPETQWRWPPDTLGATAPWVAPGLQWRSLGQGTGGLAAEDVPAECTGTGPCCRGAASEGSALASAVSPVCEGRQPSPGFDRACAVPSDVPTAGSACGFPQAWSIGFPAVVEGARSSRGAVLGQSGFARRNVWPPLEAPTGQKWPSGLPGPRS